MPALISLKINNIENKKLEVFIIISKYCLGNRFFIKTRVLVPILDIREINFLSLVSHVCMALTDIYASFNLGEPVIFI